MPCPVLGIDGNKFPFSCAIDPSIDYVKNPTSGNVGQKWGTHLRSVWCTTSVVVVLFFVFAFFLLF